MYHNFIHSFVEVYPGCFHVPVIVNSAAMNVGIHVSFPTLGYMWFPQGICLGVGSLGNMVVLFLGF